MQDSQAFLSQLYKKEYQKLFRTAFYLIGSTESAKDLVQDTFFIALSHMPDLCSHPKPEAWLMITLRNLIRNERRRAAHENIQLDTLEDHPVTLIQLPLDSILPTQLTKEERKILDWRFEKQMSYQEISQLLGISESGCRSRVSRIVAKCRQYLDELDT